MTIHGCIILRQFLKEINLLADIREYLDPRLDKRCDLPEVIWLCNHFLDIRLCHAIESVKIHGFQIFSIHPFQLHDIEHGRRLAHMAIVERLHQFLKREYLLIVGRAPAQQGYIVYHCLLDESLIDQILVGRVPAALA